MKSIKNKNILIFFFCFLFQLTAIGQKSESGYIKDVKLLYVKGLNQEAKDSLEAGLKKYPTSTGLAQLIKIIEDEGIAVKKPSSPTSKTQEGGAITSHTPIVNTPRGTNTVEKLPPIEKKKVYNVNTGFKRVTGENRVEWSKTLAENAVSIRIVYTVKGVGVLVDEIVSGRTFHIYDPGTSRAHGRSTKVELIVDYGDKIVNESGALVIDNQFFVCSAN